MLLTRCDDCKRNPTAVSHRRSGFHLFFGAARGQLRRATHCFAFWRMPMLTFARGGDHGTDLVVVPRAGGVPRPIVGGGADNSGPTFDLSGNRFAFSSARGRTPQIYSVNTDGTGERLETLIPPKGRSYRTSPDWSPDGRAIAFEQQNGNFQVWMVTLADHVMHRLTSVGENEDPSWAPDARHLVFSSTQHGIKTLWILDVPRRRFRQLATVDDARLAAWSPDGTWRFARP